MIATQTSEQVHPSTAAAADYTQGYNPTNGTTKKKFKTDFSWSYTDEPHATRRKIILQKHPEIASLFGPDWRTFPVVIAQVLTQVCMAIALQDSNWSTIFILSYIIGGTINHSLQLASHELSHNLCWESQDANKWTAIFSNLPTGLPSCITFQRYHMDHHQYQGVDGIDTDIPTAFEVNAVTNSLMKIVWLICQPLAYAFRPMFIKPKPMGKWEVINWIVQVTFDFTLIYYFGIKSFAYLLLGTLLGLGLHPAAGHFIAEHYEYITGQETYSYYGICNYLNYNVGYHNEHHDFPRVPWTRLPMVKQMAPEFYDTLPSYTSYIAVMYQFITDPNLGCYSRIKRSIATDKRERLDKTTDKNGHVSFRSLCIGAMVATISTVAYAVVLH